MAVGKWIDPNFEALDSVTLKGAYDNAHAVARRFARAFAPREASPPAMTVVLDPGQILDGTILTEVAAQTTAALTAPAANPRIDRIVIDVATGALQVVAGAEAASPTPPAIPSNTLPVAQIALTTATTEILNADITDERVAAALGDPLTLKASALTISAGSITPTGHFHTIANEAAASADVVDTISTANLAEGALLLLGADSALEVPTLADGTGNLKLAAGDFVLDDLNRRILLQRRGAFWVEIARSAPGGVWVEIQTQAVTVPVAEVDFTGIPIADYDFFELRYCGVRTDIDTFMALRIRRVGQPSFETGATAYRLGGAVAASAGATLQDIGTSGNNSIALGDIDSQVEHGSDGCISVSNLKSTSLRKKFNFQNAHSDLAGNVRWRSAAAEYFGDTDAIDAIRFRTTAGNFVEGKFVLLGMRLS